MTQLNPERVILALVALLAIIVAVNYLDHDGATVCPRMVEGTVCQAFYGVPAVTQPPAPIASGDPSTSPPASPAGAAP